MYNFSHKFEANLQLPDLKYNRKVHDLETKSFSFSIGSLCISMELQNCPVQATRLSPSQN